MPSILDRYSVRVSCDTDSGCWNWLGSKGQKGHGQLTIKNKHVAAHRLSWMLSCGPIPNGLWVLHKCHNAKCVNPDHLYLGTHKDNMRDMKETGRRKGITHGERSGRARLTERDVLWLREQRRQGARFTDLAAALGVSKGCVQHAFHGLNWRHLNA